jgi:hypothetical protein
MTGRETEMLYPPCPHILWDSPRTGARTLLVAGKRKCCSPPAPHIPWDSARTGAGTLHVAVREKPASANLNFTIQRYGRVAPMSELHAMRAYRGRGVQTPCILEFGTLQMESVSVSVSAAWPKREMGRAI